MNPQDIIKQHIKHGKIAHAYLLAGPPECMNEKEYFVADVARILNVPPTNHIVIGKNEDTITIDTMRDLKTITASSAGNTPRVVTIYNADCFTTQAANAFLKTLEEPPSHTIFFLLASSRAGILPTILSRVWTVRFSCPTFNVSHNESLHYEAGKRFENTTRNKYTTLNVGEARTFFQKPLTERYAINEKLAKSDDHGKQFLADLIVHLRYEAKNEIKKPRIANALRGRAGEYLPHAVEAYELLHLPGAPYRLILDTLASVTHK